MQRVRQEGPLISHQPPHQPSVSAHQVWASTCTTVGLYAVYHNRKCNRKVEISTALAKAKWREPAYSQALVQNKINRQRVRCRESGRKADSQTAMVDGVWS